MFGGPKDDEEKPSEDVKPSDDDGKPSDDEKPSDDDEKPVEEPLEHFENWRFFLWPNERNDSVDEYHERSGFAMFFFKGFLTF